MVRALLLLVAVIGASAAIAIGLEATKPTPEPPDGFEGLALSGRGIEGEWGFNLRIWSWPADEPDFDHDGIDLTQPSLAIYASGGGQPATGSIPTTVTLVTSSDRQTWPTDCSGEGKIDPDQCLTADLLSDLPFPIEFGRTFTGIDTDGNERELIGAAVYLTEDAITNLDQLLTDPTIVGTGEAQSGFFVENISPVAVVEGQVGDLTTRVAAFENGWILAVSVWDPSTQTHWLYLGASGVNLISD